MMCTLFCDNFLKLMNKVKLTYLSKKCPLGSFCSYTRIVYVSSVVIALLGRPDPALLRVYDLTAPKGREIGWEQAGT